MQIKWKGSKKEWLLSIGASDMKWNMAAFPLYSWNDITLFPTKYQVQSQLSLPLHLMCRYPISWLSLEATLLRRMSNLWPLWLGFYNKNTMDKASEPNLNLSATQSELAFFHVWAHTLPIVFPSLLSFSTCVLLQLWISSINTIITLL